MRIAGEHIKIALLVVIFGVFGGFFLSINNWILRGLGIGFILIDIYIEYYFLKKIDTRKDVKKTIKEIDKAKQEIKKFVKKAEKIKKEVDEAHKKIKEITNKVFGVSGVSFASWHSFRSISEQVININRRIGDWGFSRKSIKERLEDVERKIDKLG